MVLNAKIIELTNTEEQHFVDYFATIWSFWCVRKSNANCLRSSIS